MPKGVYPRDPNWKPWNYHGGTARSRGYTYVATDERYPNGRRKYKAEHRAVMEIILRRPLLRSEHPHHKNLDKSDNTPRNLELLDATAHARLHNSTITPRLCKGCGQAFKPKRNRHPSYCSPECHWDSTRRAKNFYICPVCNTSFKRTGTHVAKFCSRACRYAGHISVHPSEHTTMDSAHDTPL